MCQGGVRRAEGSSGLCRDGVPGGAHSACRDNQQVEGPEEAQTSLLGALLSDVKTMNEKIEFFVHTRVVLETSRGRCSTHRH